MAASNPKTAVDLIQATREELRKTWYTELSMKGIERTWGHLAKYLQAEGIPYLSHEIGMLFLEQQYQYSVNSNSDYNQDQMRAIQILLDFQAHERLLIRRKSKRLEIAESFREDFLAFMDFRKQSGVNSRTLKQSYSLYLERFSHYLCDQGVLHVSDIAVPHIHGFIQTIAAAYRTATVYCTSSILRVLFRYLYEQGLHTKNLAFHVPSVKCSKKSKIPSAYSQEEIQRILSVVDRGNPKGKRDYAMLLIAVRLGLRASDICGLTFDHFKWETSSIELRQKKTEELIVLPLFSDVGEAVIDYLKYGRPAVETQEIFLRLSAPIERMTAPTLHSTVTAMGKAGIFIPEGKKHGPHALRHSLASALCCTTIHRCPLSLKYWGIRIRRRLQSI
ncbi:tyrosine-type recombinase/integrase [Paenibacillus koleovorans]|uniref:tyrosine-type recombinase/integrase n=1 Tax=Paenibacillus koleovorans TaxID=121608 RepID=UPI000FD8B90B|nr:tyrosine-type recombinase/integrase [Paenibacillus koleovorans]